MNGWYLFLAIAGGIVVAAVVIFIVIPFLAHLLYKAIEINKRAEYARQAKKRNAEALRLRLARTDYEGWPLPTGQKGELIITDRMMLELPAKSHNELMRIYQDRARDLGVICEMARTEDFNGIQIKIRWRPDKTAREKEQYKSS